MAYEYLSTKTIFREKNEALSGRLWGSLGGVGRAFLDAAAILAALQLFCLGLLLPSLALPTYCGAPLTGIATRGLARLIVRNPHPHYASRTNGPQAKRTRT